MLGHGAAGHVDMRAPALLVGEDHRHLGHGFHVLGLGRAHQPRQVVAVGQRDRAFTRGHGLDLVGVAALRRPRHVGHHALQPGFGGRRPQVLQHRTEEREVVRVRAGASAHLALVLRVGQLFVGVDVGALHGRLVVDDDPRAGRKAEPGRSAAVAGIAQVRRDARLQHGRVDRLEQTVGFGLGQPRRIDQQHHVGRAGRAFGLQPRDDAGVVGIDAVDLDAGGLGEVGVQRLVGLVVAGRVQVQHLVLRLRGQGTAGQQCSSDQAQGMRGMGHGIVSAVRGDAHSNHNANNSHCVRSRASGVAGDDGAHVHARTPGLPRLHAPVVGAPGRRRRQPDAAGGHRLADVRPDRLGLGPGAGGAAAVSAGAGAGAGGRACGGPLSPRAHRRGLCVGAQGLVALALAAAPFDAAVAAHAAAGAVGGAGCRARVPDAGAAGAGAAAGAGHAAVARDGLQLGRAAGRHHRRPGARRLRLRGRRAGGLWQLRGAVRHRRGAVPAHPPRQPAAG